ncbi:MAG: hypothetical protein PHU14_16790 [Methylovulum sp.]|nr:hypothetical protein [Methylovulum sp.]
MAGRSDRAGCGHSKVSLRLWEAIRGKSGKLPVFVGQISAYGKGACR